MLSTSESKAGETLSTGSATATVTQIKSTKTNMFGVMVHVDEWCLQRARHHFFCVDMRTPGQYLEGRAACIADPMRKPMLLDFGLEGAASSTTDHSSGCDDDRLVTREDVTTLR